MTVLEKIGLYVGIPSGIVTVLEYLEKIDAISYLKNHLAWIPLQIKSLLIWLYENVILLEVNVWILLLVIIALNRVIYLLKEQESYTESKDEQIAVDWLSAFKELDDNGQETFHFVMYCEDTHKSCELDLLYRHLQQRVRIGKLEAEEVIKSLEESGLIESHYNIYHGTSYKLTDYGRKVAVAIIKSKKTVENEGK